MISTHTPHTKVKKIGYIGYIGYKFLEWQFLIERFGRSAGPRLDDR